MILTLSGISLSLGGTQVLSDIGMSVGRGQVLALLGPSGCGKTSLLRLMAGLIAPDTGEVRLNGAPPVPGRDSAMVFQSYRLLPWNTVAGNVGFALPHLPGPERRERVREMLALVGLGRVADHYPAALSGGMRQRVALARALAPAPDVLLMDEPFAALDAQSRELMQMALRRLVVADGPAVVFVTHSVDEALILGDHVLMLTPRPGRIAMRVEPPWAGSRPADPRTHPQFPTLRHALWDRLRASVLDDSGSDFFRAP